MKHLFKTLLPMFVLLIGLFMVRCKETSDVAPNGNATGVEDANTGGTGTNGYNISDIRKIDGQTWSFTLTRQGAKSKDISHLIIGVDVFCPGSPTEFRVGGFTMTNADGETEAGAILSHNEEGNGTGCSTTGFQNFFKLDFLRTFVQGETVTITFTTTPEIQVSRWLVAVKAGNSCQTSQVRGTSCDEVTEGQCSLSQGYFFAKPGNTWEGKSVSFGTTERAMELHTYNQAEGQAIWMSSNRGGKLDVKAAFLQATTIKLNFAIKGQAIPSSLDAAINTIDTYFDNLSVKLSPTTIPANSADTKALKDAAGVLSTYINRNHCR